MDEPLSFAARAARTAAERTRQRLRLGLPPSQPQNKKKQREPLCPGLHGLLAERLGPVAIGNPGRARFVRRKYREVIATEPGEFIRANCPMCGDTRQQLCISHRWDGTDGRDADLLGLPVQCLANDCMADEANRRRLAELVFVGLDAEQRRQVLVCRPGREAALDAKTLRRRPGPGKVVPLCKLPADHPAISSLRSLGYDPAALGEEWGVTLCAESRDHPAAEGRLILPVTADGARVGWLALHPGERDWMGGRIPRYYTPRCFRPELTLYNLDRARRRSLVVVCEQPPDAWRVGPAGVALFGPKASWRQICDLRKLALRQQVVLFQGDGDPAEVERLRGQFDRPVHLWVECREVPRQLLPPVVVRLPGGVTPAVLSTAELWGLIQAQGAEQGVVIDLPEAEAEG